MLFLRGISALSNQNQVNHVHNVNFYFAWDKLFIENILKDEFFLFIHTLT